VLNAIRHPYDGVTTQVMRVGSEEAAVLGRDPEAADADAGAVRHVGKIPRFDSL